MTIEEFLANPPEEVDIWLIEGKPPHRGKIGSSPDFFGGLPTRGYRVANTVTPFDTAHKNIVKQALKEGKPVPPEVLADYPEVASKVKGGRQLITIKKEAPLVPTYKWLAGTQRYLAGFYTRGGKKFAITFPSETGIGGRINILAKHIKVEKTLPEVAPKAELDGLVDVVAKKGALMYAGETLGLGKTGDVSVNWAGRNALKEIGFLLEEHPELAKEVPKEINLLLKGQAYEGIFEELRKAREIASKPWRMTRQEFTNIEKGVVELLPIPPGRWERAVIHPSPKKKGYIQWSLIELNPKTGVWEPGSDIQFSDRQALRRHLEVIHRQEVKQAIDEGRSVPQEVLRDYPDLTKNLATSTQEHVS